MLFPIVTPLITISLPVTEYVCVHLVRFILRFPRSLEYDFRNAFTFGPFTVYHFTLLRSTLTPFTIFRVTFVAVPTTAYLYAHTHPDSDYSHTTPTYVTFTVYVPRYYIYHTAASLPTTTATGGPLPPTPTVHYLFIILRLFHYSLPALPFLRCTILAISTFLRCVALHCYICCGSFAWTFGICRFYGFTTVTDSTFVTICYATVPFVRSLPAVTLSTRFTTTLHSIRLGGTLSFGIPYVTF